MLLLSWGSVLSRKKEQFKFGLSRHYYTVISVSTCIRYLTYVCKLKLYRPLWRRWKKLRQISNWSSVGYLKRVQFSNWFRTIRVILNYIRFKLHQFGFSKQALKWFASYLTERRQSVQINDRKSSEPEVTFGVHQGVDPWPGIIQPLCQWPCCLH